MVTPCCWLQRPSHRACSTAQRGICPLLHFAPVGMIAQGPLVWAVNKDLPVSGLPDLIALARQRPGALNYGSAGVGGVNHLVLESLKARTGTFIVHIRTAASRQRPWMPSPGSCSWSRAPSPRWHRTSGRAA
jgi:tripartite-type tricarboxylate transporter receptor subunit TctC